jgi:hypothetical protein
MAQSDWIAGNVNVNAFRHFCGVARIIVPDNLKTGIVKNARNELVINKTNPDMAEHYCVAVIPARVKTPKDNPRGCQRGQNISTFILVVERRVVFFLRLS